MTPLARRKLLHWLTGAAGGTFLAPLATGLVREAYGQTAQRKRLVVFGFGNGYREADLKPVGGGNELRPILAPLEAYKDRLVVLDSMFNPHNKDLHGNGWATLTVRPGDPGGISLDRYVAKAIGGDLPFSSINQCLLGDTFGKKPHLSADGPKQEFPAEFSPVRGFKSILGGVSMPTGGVAGASDTAAIEKSVWDFVKDDVNRLERALPGPERSKLQQYITSVQELEKQLATTSVNTEVCSTLKSPDAGLHSESFPTFAPDVRKDIVEANVDLVANALICGRTAVAAYSHHGNSAAHNKYVFLGEDPNGTGDTGLHGAHHNMNASLIEKIQQFHFGLVRRLADRLAGISEGNGTMLDNTLIMVVNSGGGIHHGGWDKHIVVLLGGLGRIKTGQYLSCPGRCVSDVYVSVANAFGINTTTFGTPEHCKGPMPGLAV